MGILRNSIDVIGITPDNELPSQVIGQLIQYAEVEHIHLPEDTPSINTILQISIDVKIHSTRVIKAPLSRIVVIDGEKELKIVYLQRKHHERKSICNLILPYNTFIEVPNGSSDIENINLYITDAYFHPIDNRQIYSHILYMIDVDYKSIYKKINKLPKRTDIDIDNKNLEIGDNLDVNTIDINENINQLDDLNESE